VRLLRYAEDAGARWQIRQALWLRTGNVFWTQGDDVESPATLGEMGRQLLPAESTSLVSWRKVIADDEETFAGVVPRDGEEWSRVLPT
jgi:hypothetical protein